MPIGLDLGVPRDEDELGEPSRFASLAFSGKETEKKSSEYCS
jgi:hypothetical protein